MPNYRRLTDDKNKQALDINDECRKNREELKILQDPRHIDKLIATKKKKDKEEAEKAKPKRKAKSSKKQKKPAKKKAPVGEESMALSIDEDNLPKEGDKRGKKN